MSAERGGAEVPRRVRERARRALRRLQRPDLQANDIGDGGGYFCPKILFWCLSFDRTELGKKWELFRYYHILSTLEYKSAFIFCCSLIAFKFRSSLVH